MVNPRDIAGERKKKKKKKKNRDRLAHGWTSRQTYTQANSNAIKGGML